mmetsp:Transcript_39644/g.112430  ORF Transcript_39644/g.112430 Transcript_39644/m.112430 type:complete len:246 (-) Transcript_39644:1509-2246(-)
MHPRGLLLPNVQHNHVFVLIDLLGEGPGELVAPQVQHANLWELKDALRQAARDGVVLHIQSLQVVQALRVCLWAALELPSHLVGGQVDMLKLLQSLSDSQDIFEPPTNGVVAESQALQGAQIRDFRRQGAPHLAIRQLQVSYAAIAVADLVAEVAEVLLCQRATGLHSHAPAHAGTLCLAALVPDGLQHSLVLCVDQAGLLRHVKQELVLGHRAVANHEDAEDTFREIRADCPDLLATHVDNIRP